MSKLDYVKYFMRLRRMFSGIGGSGTPDRLQGGIGIIRNPDQYGVDTLAYWHSECKKAGY